MSSYKSIEEFFSTPGDKITEKFISKNIDISEQVHDLLLKKNLSQKQLANLLGKTEPEVSRWLSGSHNLSLKSIARIEVALEEDIILTPLEAEKIYSKVVDVNITINAFPNDLYHSTNENDYEKASFNSSNESYRMAA